MSEAEDKIDETAARFAREECSAAVLTRAVRRQMKQGCGDNSCEFRKPTGMATNGGCRCWNVMESAFYAIQRVLLSSR